MHRWRLAGSDLLRRYHVLLIYFGGNEDDYDTLIISVFIVLVSQGCLAAPPKILRHL